MAGLVRLDVNATPLSQIPTVRTSPVATRWSLSFKVTLLRCFSTGTAPPVTVKLVALVAVPPGVVTVIGPVIAPAGTVAVIWVLLLTVNVAFVPLNLTLVVPVKFVPVIVTEVPSGPLVGLNDEILGATVKFVELVAVPPGVVTAIGPVIAPRGYRSRYLGVQVHGEARRRSSEGHRRSSREARARDNDGRADRAARGVERGDRGEGLRWKRPYEASIR